jgi:hypothetical protein
MALDRPHLSCSTWNFGTGEQPQIRFHVCVSTRRNMVSGLDNRRMKGNGRQDRCPSGYGNLDERDRFRREGQVRQARRNGESLQQRGLKGVAVSERKQKRDGHSKHLHHDANAEQHDQDPARTTEAASLERLMRHSGLSYDVRSPVTRITRKLSPHSLPDHRTTNTEQVACWTTRVDTLPSRNRPMAPRPFAPVTMRSALRCWATLRISSAGFPSLGAGSTR